MSIIKLNPAFKDYLWGGTKLKEKYGSKIIKRASMITKEDYKGLKK